jgi:D-alanyl-D-alanine carboxypeptidase (penicillin-binding protein 5/6)
MLRITLLFSLCILLLFSAVMTIPVYGKIEGVTDYDSVEVMKIQSNTSLTNLKAKAAILMDCSTGTVLLEKNSHEKLPIASITKIMSMMLIMEAIDAGVIAYDTKVTVSEYSWSFGGSQVWLEPGEVFTVDELLKAVAIHSANDATVALAEAIAGSEETFVAMMNQKARELGMKDTNFLDCTGLTDTGHYSSAYDIALMSRELLLKHPEITDYTSVWHAKFRENVPGKNYVSLDNTNKLVRHYNGTVGLKTGYTSAAGHCLSAAAVRDGQQLISVVLGEPDSNTRFAESRKLLDYGFANFETVLMDNMGDVIQQVEVRKGLQPVTNAVYREDVKLLLRKGEKGKIERTVNLATDIKAPVKSGQKIGEVVYILSGREVGKADIVASSDVQRATFLRIMLRLMQEWFCLGRVAS